MSSFGSSGSRGLSPLGQSSALSQPGGSVNLADVLERVLDKGVVIAGDIQINLLDIELLTIKLRLVVASVDTARRMGINWWESDPMLAGAESQDDRKSLTERVKHLERELERSSGSNQNAQHD
jgi:hypothetical protein